jgi:membrane associated rhomboid family serine protease
MEYAGIFVLCMVTATCLVSYYGIKDAGVLDRYSFHVDSILIQKDYKRLITSGFVHTGWMHLVFNMVTLYYFSKELEIVLGLPRLLLLYAGSLVGGNLLALYIHRNHGDYRAVGASGAVSGMVFASIALFPGMEMSLMFIPYFIPSWAFGLLYVLYSIYGIKSQRDNIGHEAHLGGGLIGMVIAILYYPQILSINFIPILLITIPSVVFFYLILSRPGFLLVENPFKSNPGVYTLEDKSNDMKRRNEKELDHLLDKISKTGINGLTKQEKERLEKLSNSR